jgi:beta-barrel assembly-enhancing protease
MPALKMHRFSAIALTLACTLLAGAPARATDTQLPNMGSSAGAIASPEEQRQYGFYVLHELRNQGLVLDDALLTDYINTLGYRLVAFSPKPDQPFTFFVVRDNSINAFALPGGFVGVNAGLITTTTSESELAAVLAHEISHVTQQHLVRAVEAEQKYAPLMILAMVGAIIAASHQSPYSTSNTDVGVLATAQALAQQMEINFTRADESEADRVGIQTLARANFDPNAMADFFSRMQRALRPGFDENDVPALLMDHPVTTERISEAKARAESLTKEMDATVTVGEIGLDGTEHPVASSTEHVAGGKGGVASGSHPATSAPAVSPALLPPALSGDPGAIAHAISGTTESRPRQRARSEAYYAVMRERTRVLASDHPAQIAAYYAENLHNDAAFNTVANRYGYALALALAGDPRVAIEVAQKLVTEQPENLALQLAAGKAEVMSGARDAALKRFASLAVEDPDNRPLLLAHADALLEGGDKASARHALELLRPQLSRDDEDPELQTTFGRACELSGDPVRAGEAFAAAAFLNGRAEDALNQLKQLLKRNDLDYYQRSRIEARIEEFTPIVLELRRRKIRPADQGKFGIAESACSAGTCAHVSSARNNLPLQ